MDNTRVAKRLYCMTQMGHTQEVDPNQEGRTMLEMTSENRELISTWQKIELNGKDLYLFTINKQSINIIPK